MILVIFIVIIIIATKPLRNNLSTLKIEENKGGPSEDQAPGSLPPINQHVNKHLTFSVSASKDLKMSLVKKAIDKSNDHAVDTINIKKLLEENIDDMSPIDLYSSLYR